VAMVSEGRRPHAEPVAAGSVWSVWRVWRVSVMVVVVVVSCVLRGRLRSELSSRLGAGFLLSTDLVSCWSLEAGVWRLDAVGWSPEASGESRDLLQETCAASLMAHGSNFQCFGAG